MSPGTQLRALGAVALNVEGRSHELTEMALNHRSRNRLRGGACRMLQPEQWNPGLEYESGADIDGRDIVNFSPDFEYPEFCTHDSHGWVCTCGDL